MCPRARGSRLSDGLVPRKAGATIKAGILVPAGAINPLTIADEGGLELLGNVGEFLVLADQALVTSLGSPPAGSRTPAATVWTFKIRQGVKFNDGTPMTVDDVVYSFKYPVRPEERLHRPLGLLRDSWCPTAL